MHDFFITLVSNSSTDIFPNNTTSSFTIHLPEKISLRGIWDVAIAEIHYNYNFFNVSDRNNKLILRQLDSTNNDTSSNTISKSPRTHFIQIPNGYYNTIRDLVNTINHHLAAHLRKDKILLSIDAVNSRTHVYKENIISDIDNIFLEGRLNMQLGFEPHQDILRYKASPHIGNLCFGVPDQMLIYTDIIEPTFIGHERAYVLKVVNTEARQLQFGDACYKEYTHMHYMRVQKREFDTISIDIRDHTGKFMPFQHGVLMVKLHFKQNEV